MRTVSDGGLLETAMVGCQGIVGAPVVLPGARSMHQFVVTVRGSALRIRAAELIPLMDERPRIREHLLQYVQSLMVQTSQTALCAVLHDAEQRLGCWLSLACEALNATVLGITHEHLSLILGLRRASITEVLIRFEELGVIRKTRGFLQVLDRKQLELKACGCYKVIANAYDCVGRVDGVSSAGAR